MARKCTKQFFDEIAEDLYYLVADCSHTIERAGEIEAEYVKQQGVYGFKAQAAKHNCKSFLDLFEYGKLLAGDAAAF